jgi:hypothetical protein
MKVKREYSFDNSGNKRRVTRRRIEIEQGERISIRVMDRKTEPPKEEEIIVYFMPGVLTLEWEQGKTL